MASRPQRQDATYRGGITYEDIRRANEIANGPILQTLNEQGKKIEDIRVSQADHVRRTDMDEFRREVQKLLGEMDSKYLRREIADQRYQDVLQRIAAIEATAVKADDRRFTLSNNAVFWAFAALSALLAVIGLVLTIVAMNHK